MSSIPDARPPPPPDWQPQYQQPPRKRSGAGRAIAILLIMLILLAIIFYTPVGNMLISNLTGNSYPAGSSFRLTRQLEIDISHGDINYLCDIPQPISLTGSMGTMQNIRQVTTQPVAENPERHGHPWIVWEGSGGGSVTLEVTYWADVRTTVWDVGPGNSGVAADIPSGISARQTGDEWEMLDGFGNSTGEFKIWPSHPSIQTLARELTSPELTVYENVKSIYDYIRANVEYHTIPGAEAKPCLATLSDGWGDCDDQSILLISLLRAVGIPSWLVFGILHDSFRNDWGAHAWVEFFMPLNGGSGEAMTIDPANGEFLVRNCNRLEEWKSDGIGENLSDYYSLLSYNYTMSSPDDAPPAVSVTEAYTWEYDESTDRVYALVELSFNRVIFEMAVSPQKV